MAVSSFWGFEARHAATDNITITGTAAYSTAQHSTGAASMQCNPASGASGYVSLSDAGASSIGFNLYIASLPSVDRIILGSTGGVNLRLTSTGAIAVYSQTTLQGTSSPISTLTWHWISSRWFQTTAPLLQIDGVDSGITGTLSGHGNPVPLGCSGTEASSIDIYFDDVIILNASGFLAPSKVDIALPIGTTSNTGWTDGNGGTTNIWEGVNNTPPIGVASANEAANPNVSIRATASVGGSYVATLETYTTLGVGVSDSILAVQSVIRHGEDIATGTKTGTLGAVSNPTISDSLAFNFGNDGGAHGAESGTNFWVTKFGTLTNSPSVTVGTSPTLTVTRTLSEARVGCVDFMGLFVAWTPVASFSRLAQAQAKIKGIAVIGLAQSQADIKAKSIGVAQAQSDIKATSKVFAQALALIPNWKFAQAQAKISKSAGYAQSLSIIDTGIHSALDTFTRTTSNSLGTADIGGGWTLISGTASNWSTNGARAILAGSASLDYQALKSVYLGPIMEASIDFTYDSSGNATGSAYMGIGPAFSIPESIAHGIFLTIDHSNGAVSAIIQAGSFNSVSLSTTTILVGHTYSLKVQINFAPYPRGASPYVRAKLWEIGSSEPGWSTNVIDYDSSRPFNFGIPFLRTYLGNATAQFSFDNFTASAIGWTESGQAQAKIQSAVTTPQYAQAQSSIKASSRGWAQGNADIKSTSKVLAQALADIKQTYPLYVSTSTTIYIATGTDDGWVGSDGGVDTSSADMGWGDNDTYYSRSFARFNLTSIPSNAICTSASLNVYFTNGSKSAEVRVTTSDWAPLDSSDYNIGTGSSIGTIPAVNNSWQIVALTTGAIQATFGGILPLMFRRNPETLDFGIGNIATYEGGNIPYLSISYNYVGSGTFAQAQAKILRITPVFAQTQADIKVTTNIFAQAQACIRVTTYGQAQADIKATYTAFAQAQSDIKATYQGYVQTQADIKAISNGFAQAQADIKALGKGLGQTQATIQSTITVTVYAQANADIKSTSYGLAQTQADIKATSTTYAQAQAKLNTFGVSVFAQALSNIKGNALDSAQAQAKIKAFGVQGYAQAQTDIKVISSVFSQAQADIKAVGNGFAQAQSDIKVTTSVFAQSNADIKAITTVFAQAQSDIKVQTQVFAQAQAQIKTTYLAQAQAQADIKVTSFGFAQAQAAIRVTTYAQAQADIKSVSNGFANALATILLLQITFAQSQADILGSSNGYGQSVAWIYIPQIARPISDVSNDGNWIGTVRN